MNVETTELRENEFPSYDASDNPTGCCPRFNPDSWDGRVMHFRDRLFVKAKTRSIMHIPLNMGKVFKRTFKAIEDAGAADPGQCMVLSHDISPWSAEHLFAVPKDVPGQDMTRLSGDYRTRVFEGPYRNMGRWHRELLNMASNKNAKTFFFYTTCPRCAKQYKKNYVVGLVAVEAKDSQQDVRSASVQE